MKHETVIAVDGEYVSVSCTCGWAKVGSLFDYDTWGMGRRHLLEVGA